MYITHSSELVRETFIQKTTFFVICKVVALRCTCIFVFERMQSYMNWICDFWKIIGTSAVLILSLYN